MRAAMCALSSAVLVTCLLIGKHTQYKQLTTRQSTAYLSSLLIVVICHLSVDVVAQGGFFGELDMNNDGGVSVAEVRGLSKSFVHSTA